MPATVKEGVSHAFEITKWEEIAASIEIVFEEFSTRWDH
jgi:hypothetical protein